MKNPINSASKKVYSIFNKSSEKRTRRKPPGQTPGTAIYTGIQKLEEVLLTVHDFDEDHFTSVPIKKIEKSKPYLNDKSKTWIQVRGLHDVEKLREIWEYFNLHPLVQEDIVNTSQRPKVEPYPDAVFLVIRMITRNIIQDERSSVNLETEQISLILGKNYVLSFQESDNPIFEPVLKRLELKNTRLRKYGPDYLTYALIDNIVDHYFHALDLISESIENVEEEIVLNPKELHLRSIHALRRDLILFRKSVWSLRDGINSLIRDDSHLIRDDVKIFLRDVYDHLIQVIDSIETNREMVYGLYDMYMSGLSNRMNEVMKVLTIIATIFIPLTFIAGVYGMIFDPEVSPWNMPELNWYWGYPASLLVMAIIVFIMLFYFRRKMWI
ncbi:MAG: magnesium/cobalt transporter CorA [Balneolaceae bacterium]